MSSNERKRTALVTTDDRRSSHLTFYLAILLAGIFAFLVENRYIADIYQKIIPFGDSFTYAIFQFRIIDEARKGLVDGARAILGANFNWTQDFLILTLSSFLHKSLSSLLFVNVFFHSLCSIAIFESLRGTRLSLTKSSVIAFIFFALPWNFHLANEFDLSSLMPDPIFFNALVTAFFISALAIQSDSFKSTISASLAWVLCVWSRGNAFIYVALAFGIISSIVLLAFFKAKNFRTSLPTSRHLVAFALLFSVMTLFFVVYEGRAIYFYYFGISTSVFFDKHTKIVGALWILRNFPGLIILNRWYPPNTSVALPLAFAVTLTAHAALVAFAIRGFRIINSQDLAKRSLAFLMLSGAILFYAQLFMALVSFSGYYSDPDFRDIHTFEPALAGLVCCALGALGSVLPKLSWAYSRSGALAAFVLSTCIAVGTLTTSAEKLVELRISDRDALSFNTRSQRLSIGCTNATYLPSSALEDFSVELDRATHGYKMASLWYGVFNPAIVAFYSIKNGLTPPVAATLDPEKDRYFWMATFNPSLLTPLPLFKKYVSTLLDESEFVVLPERFESYEGLWASPMRTYRNDLRATIQSYPANWKVWGLIDEKPSQILVLKRDHNTKEDQALSTFISKDYGTPSQAVEQRYNGANRVIRECWSGKGQF